ncbi:MAG TPA: type I restriction endonuclease subunit R [Anaerolineales bacterium]|nr:type I restriction endonuclease subunit R [Anaerolineales bacterium]
MAIITENQIEKAIISVFVNNLGYRHLNCFDVDTTERESETDVVIKPLLKRKLKELNPHLSDEVLEEAFKDLCNTRFDKSNIHANREIYALLKDGVEVNITTATGRTEPERVKVIDFKDECKNDYLVTSQLWIKGDLRLRPDLIVFINGLPLLFIELKNSNVPVRNAYDDNLTRYKKQIPLLFNYNALCMLSNGIETKIGSFNSGYEYFFNWLRYENEKQVPDKKRIKDYGVSLDYAVLGLCEKKRLLDYLENFIFYYNDTIKIAAKNHQFLGVNNAVEKFALRLQHDAAGTDKENKGKLGVFWHTQGSGKSFSMIFFTRKIFRHFTGNYTFLIVTDREDLDGQIYRNFLGAGAFSKDTKCQPSNSEDLRNMLQTNTRYIFTLIQKFRYDKGKQYPLLSNRNDIIVIVDEAHRTQYKDLAENMRTGLPNAQYIAFTGTPLLGSRELTKNWFGDTVSEYNFKQSIEDEATVPLFYNKRVPQVLLQNDEIDDDLAEIVSDENLSDENQSKLKGDFAKEISILKADDRLELIAKDIVYHFPRRGYWGKGMVITIDKFTAVKMYDKVKRLWEEEKRELQKQINESKDQDEKAELKRILEWMRKTDMAVIVSEEAGEEEKFEKEGLDIRLHRKRMKSVDENGQEMEDKFKNPNDPLQLVFVCSMWLTGFDAPTVSTLYLDKPMKDHTLMQTIARANRVTDFIINGKPKKNGLVVDYYNVFRNLKKAFASYGGGSIGTVDDKDENSPARDIEQLFVLLKDAIAECDEYCKTINVDLHQIKQSKETFSKLSVFEAYADTILANDEQKKQFIVYDNTIDALYEACKPEIVGRRNEFPLAAIIQYLRQVIDGKADRENLDSARRRLSQLLNESIIAQGDNVESQGLQVAEQSGEYKISSSKQIDLSKLDVDRLKEEYKQAPYKNIEISDLRAFIQDKLQIMMDRNVTRRSFAEILQEIIDRYNSGNSTNENYFNDLMVFVEKMKVEEMRAAREGLTEEELELFDLLKKDKLTKDEEQKVKLAAKNLLHRLKDERPKVLINDWHKDIQTKLQVQAAIKKILDTHLPESYDQAIYVTKCDAVFNHYYIMATSGDSRAFVV